MSVTISKDKCGSYFASILSDDIILQSTKTTNAVGIDVGIKALITTSDGVQIKNLPNNQRTIKHIQRRLAKKKKGSLKYNKLKLRLAKLHRTIVRQRAWFLHNISKHLVDNYDLIVTEDLNVAGMLKNHKLAGAIQRASWGELFRQIEYKCRFYGKEFVKISKWFPSSKMCNNCGAIKEDLKLSDRIYNCDCGFSIDRDLNASRNIKAVGVTTDIQSVMGCKTYSKELSLKQAIPNDLISFI
jgi:putative transposase